MTADEIQRALDDIRAEKDPTLDWQEARRLAGRPEYDILPVLETLVGEIAHELGRPSPYHS